MSSGVLSRGLQMGINDSQNLWCKNWTSIQQKENEDVETYVSKYKFNQECKKVERPPFPSSLTYDSKIWTYERTCSEGNYFGM